VKPASIRLFCLSPGELETAISREFGNGDGIVFEGASIVAGYQSPARQSANTC
jgi:hypothetical protein